MIVRLPPPQQFSSFRLIRPLGQGAMGHVYLAENTILHRIVALKFLHAGPGDVARQRLLAEARAIARVEHPNVACLYAVHDEAGHSFLEMEYVRGRSLIEEPRPTSHQRVLQLGVGLARGLAAAHKQGVLHRDIKPGNIAIGEDDIPKLLDFGLAKLQSLEGEQPDDGASLSARASDAAYRIPSEPTPNHAAVADLDATVSAALHRVPEPQHTAAQALPSKADGRVGTPLYMAPEIWRGEPATPQSDLYSLGVVLYELCTGSVPHRGSTAEALSRKVQNEDAPPLRQGAPRIPAPLARVIERCLLREAQQRWNSAPDLCNALEAVSRRLVIQRRAVWSVLLGLPSIAALFIGGDTIVQARRTRQAVDALVALAEPRLLEARRLNRETERLQQQALAAFDEQRNEEGERIWADSRRIADQSYGAYREATRLLDAALLRDPHHTLVRQRFAESLYEQAERLDRDHKPVQRDEVLARLSGYVEYNEYSRRWQEPGRLTVSSSPSGALIEAERYEPEESGRLTIRTLGGLGQTPLQVRPLPPGSYRLRLTLAGRMPILVPLRVVRGEALVVDAPLPWANEIPDGYVFVPPGRFLFGSAVDEQVRQSFLEAVPLHSVTTAAYLIARHETTFGEWLTYLDTLPAAERAERWPRSPSNTSQGELELRTLPDGRLQLTLRPTNAQVRTALRGEPLIFPQRPAHKEVPWEQLPVVGIDYHDAVAYARWLNNSGRVPGARLCTEMEWERAARGADGRNYPHGNLLWADDANYDATYARDSHSMGPDAVGSHPASRSPFGVDDMTGNVWEWVDSSRQRGRSLLRGGAYYFDVMTVRLDNRKPIEPSLRDHRAGLRICASYPAPPIANPR